MSKKRSQPLITPEILRGAVIGSFTKLNPRYMMKNPVMFVVEVGFFISLLLSFFPGLFGDVGNNLRMYNIVVAVILLITVPFANFAESVAEGDVYKRQDCHSIWDGSGCADSGICARQRRHENRDGPCEP